jgi:hypothetical protein
MRRAPGGRSRVLYVRLTEEEDRQIRDRAETQGLSAQRLLIESALSGSAESAAARRQAGVEVRAARIVLKGIANNLNQLTKGADANQALPVDLVGLTEDLGRAVLAVEQTTSALGMAFGSDKQGSGEGHKTRMPS